MDVRMKKGTYIYLTDELCTETSILSCSESDSSRVLGEVECFLSSTRVPPVSVAWKGCPAQMQQWLREGAVVVGDGTWGGMARIGAMAWCLGPSKVLQSRISKPRSHFPPGKDGFQECPLNLIQQLMKDYDSLVRTFPCNDRVKLTGQLIGKFDEHFNWLGYLSAGENMEVGAEAYNMGRKECGDSFREMYGQKRASMMLPLSERMVLVRIVMGSMAEC
ncbi:hypothetical protein V8E55_008131 [Tylopilus felleus]